MTPRRFTAHVIDTLLDRGCVVCQPQAGDTDILAMTVPTGDRYQLRITPA